jgi:gliding motility-associated-like protein
MLARFLFLFSIAFFSGFYSQLKAQAPFYGDCAFHVRVCGDTIFPIDATSAGIQDVPPPGSLGNPSPNAVPPSTNAGCLQTGETFPTWILIEIQSGGTLEFTFGANGAQAGFYDWIMYDFTNITCADIANNLVPPVRCNWNGSPVGGTGMVAALPVGGDSSNYEAPLQVNACDKFMIVFNNFSSVQANVPMEFFGSANVCQPVYPVDISPLPITICVGDSAQLNVGSGASYSWTPVQGLSDPNSPNPKASPDSTTTYICRTFVPCPFFEKFDTVTVAVRYGGQITAFPDTFFCEGSGGVQIGATVSGGVAPFTYVWSPNNGSLNDVNSLITIANPAVDTRYYVYAVGFDGCETNIDSIDVRIEPLPVVDAGLDLEFCEDAPGVFLQGSIVNVSGTYSLQWLPSTGLYCDTCLVTYAQPGSTTAYTLRATSLVTGCSSDSTTLNTLSSALVIVKPRPDAYAGADTLICQGDSAQLYGVFTGAGPVYTFEWAPPHGIAVPNIVNPKASPAYTTPYYLVVTSNGCESIADTMMVVVRPIPIVSGGNTKNICEGDSIQLDAQVQQGIAQAFRWTPGSGLSDSTAFQPLASPATSTTYTLRAYNGPCSSLPVDILVSVHPVPIASLPNDTTLCSTDDSLRITATVTGGTQPFSMNWFPVSGLGNPFSISTNAKPSVTTLYYYQVSSGSGPTLCATTDSILVSIVPGVVANLVADTGIICPGKQVQLQASGGVGNATFIWSPSIGISNPNSPVTFAAPDTTTQYTVMVSEGLCRDSAKWTIEVHPNPRAGFTLSQVQGCGPLEVQTSNLSGNALSYTWDFGDGSPQSNERNPKHVYSAEGAFEVSLVVRGVGGCLDTFTYPMPVQVSKDLLVDFTSDPPCPVEIAGPEAEIYFRNKSKGATVYHWDFGDGGISAEQDPIYRYRNPGKYMVTLTAGNGKGCQQALSKGPIVVVMPVFSVPNVFTPNADGIHDVFRVEYNGDELFHIQIFDRWGNKQFDTRNKEQGWDGKDLNGNACIEGTYYYSIRIGSRNYSGVVNLIR